jgi:hypothetical protein
MGQSLTMEHLEELEAAQQRDAKILEREWGRLSRAEQNDIIDWSMTGQGVKRLAVACGLRVPDLLDLDERRRTSALTELRTET